MKTREPSEEVFLKDVSGHEMKILNDQGVYRHLLFKRHGNSDLWFEIITWPGKLAISGDMGTYVFSRLPDMFEFFRSERSTENGLFVNLSYWGEKLEAVDNHRHQPGYKEFSLDRFKDNVHEDLASWLESPGLTKDEQDELRQMVASMLGDLSEDDERSAYEAVQDFSHTIRKQKFEFSEPWEWNSKVYTYDYVWCSFAIAWAIRKYDERPSDAFQAA